MKTQHEKKNAPTKNILSTCTCDFGVSTLNSKILNIQMIKIQKCFSSGKSKEQDFTMHKKQFTIFMLYKAL